MYKLVLTLPGKIVILLLFILFGLTTVIYAEPMMQIAIEFNMQNHYNKWDDPIYDDWQCSECSVECEKYFETQLGYPCYLVYGHRCDETGKLLSAHMWNLVEINGKYFEFESTNLHFMKRSNEFHVVMVQYGFYVDGRCVNHSYDVENWENLI